MTSCALELAGVVCGSTPARLYLPGLRCRAHTPALLAGRVDHRPDPARTLEGVRAPRGHEAAPAREPVCPGCHQHPREHRAHCPMGPRARFAMAADGSIRGTAKRGPE